jgi:predicted nucleic acid-binding protein
MMIILDASVIYKWIVNEDEISTRKARAIRQRYLSGKEKISAPDILLYEIGNIFAYKTKLSSIDRSHGWNSFLLLEVPVIAATPPFISTCLTYSQKYQISVYDAAYVVLAQKRKCIFITADTKLVSRLHAPFVHSL